MKAVCTSRRQLLRQGAAADFIVIDVDPFRDGAEVLLDATVRLTVLAGEVVHSEDDVAV